METKNMDNKKKNKNNKINNSLELNINLLKKLTKQFTSIEYTQGTGSNTSVKFGEEMLIKASGFRLDELISKDGFSQLNYLDLKQGYLDKKLKTQIQVNDIVKSSTSKKSKFKPSIETGFHSFLNKYTIHIHPMFLNLVLCLKNSDEILQDLYSEFNFLTIKYCKPGNDLSCEIFKKYSNEKIIFLKNHGLIITTDNVNESIQLTKKICDISKKYILSNLKNNNVEIFKYKKIESVCDNVFMGTKINNLKNNKFVFPDAIVFLNDIFLNEKNNFKVSDRILYFDLNENLVKNIDEILYVNDFILNFGSYFGKLNYLSLKKVLEILNMDEEKYRKNLLSNN